MLNLKNGAFLLGLFAGIVFTALLTILALTLIQVTRPVSGVIPQATASAIAVATVQPTAMPAGEPTVAPTAAPAAEPTLEPTAVPTGEPTVEPTAVPAGEPTVKPTAVPAGEPTVEPTAVPAGEPTVKPTPEPTAAFVAAPIDFPYRNFPTPVPEPVKVPYNGGSQGNGVNLTGVSLAGEPKNTLQVKPGQGFDMALDYNVWSTLEPIPGGDNSGRCASTCIVNLTVGMVSSDGSYKPLTCIYFGTPGNEPGVVTSWSSSITPPTTPGVYGLRLDYHLTYNCQQALTDVNPERPGISLATITVEATSVVPKTGQTTCYDSSGAEIPCAGTGQDGEYQAGIDPAVPPSVGIKGAYTTPAWTGLRFTDNGDGTVKDNLTALIWLKDANCFGERVWETALSDANTLASSSCGLSDGSVAGDWRLPNVNELHSLVDHTQSPALPAGYPFTGGVQSNVYWSSTSVAKLTSYAWNVLLYDGNVNNGFPKAQVFYVWPVRGGL